MKARKEKSTIGSSRPPALRILPSITRLMNQSIRPLAFSRPTDLQNALTLGPGLLLVIGSALDPCTVGQHEKPRLYGSPKRVKLKTGGSLGARGSRQAGGALGAVGPRQAGGALGAVGPRQAGGSLGARGSRQAGGALGAVGPRQACGAVLVRELSNVSHSTKDTCRSGDANGKRSTPGVGLGTASLESSVKYILCVGTTDVGKAVNFL